MAGEWVNSYAFSLNKLDNKKERQPCSTQNGKQRLLLKHCWVGALIHTLEEGRGGRNGTTGRWATSQVPEAIAVGFSYLL